MIASSMSIGVVSDALKKDFVRQTDRGEHSMSDRVDSDCAADDSGHGPSTGIHLCVVPMAVHDSFRRLKFLWKVVVPPDHCLPRLILQARDTRIQSCMHANTVGILVVRQEAFKKPQIHVWQNVEKHTIWQ